MKKILLAAIVIFAGCGAPPERDRSLIKGIGRYETGLLGSEVMRVPIKEDGVVCYVAVESRELKSINCIKVAEVAQRD